MNQRTFAGAVFASIFLTRSFEIIITKMISKNATTKITIVDIFFFSMDSVTVSMK